jgi:hypothetical protein
MNKHSTKLSQKSACHDLAMVRVQEAAVGREEMSARFVEVHSVRDDHMSSPIFQIKSPLFWVCVIVSFALHAGISADCFAQENAATEQTTSVLDDKTSEGQVPVWLGDARLRDHAANVYLLETEPRGTEHQVEEQLHELVVRTTMKHFSKQWSERDIRRAITLIEDELDEAVYENRKAILPYEDTYTQEVAKELNLPSASFFKGYVQLDYTEAVAERIELALRNLQLRDRLAYSGLMAISLCGSLFVLFGYLRLNHATRGFYAGRLQLASALLIGALASLVVFLWLTFLA